MNGRTLCGFLLVSVAGCAVNVNPGGGGPSTPSRTSVRVAHAAPSEPAFDVCVGGEVIVENARYGRITDYADSRTGVVTLRLIDAGSNCSDVIGGDITRDLLANRAYTMVALDDVDPLVLQDDTSPVSSGRARIRVINASRNSQAIDVYEEGGLRFFDDVRYNEPDDYDYITVPTGIYNLTIEPLVGSNTPIVETADLERGHVYTVFVFGFIDAEDNEEPFEATVHDDGFAGTL